MKYKKLHCSVKSNKKCVVCAKPLKQNLVNRKPKAEFCFKHYPLSKKNRMEANPKSKRKEVEVPK